jgi:hypothetical protein
MRYHFRHLLTAALILFSISMVRADTVTYHLTTETSQTLESLGTKFIAGCVVLALGIVSAAFVSRKK